jgi:hypothetical protein
VVRFDATTLWHFDAAERAPSTTSFATDVADLADLAYRFMSASLRLCCKTPLLFSSGPICVLLSLWRSPLGASYGIIGLHAW